MDTWAWYIGPVWVMYIHMASGGVAAGGLMPGSATCSAVYSVAAQMMLCRVYMFAMLAAVTDPCRNTQAGVLSVRLV